MSLVSQRKQLGLIKEKTVYMNNGGKGRKEKGNKRENDQNKTLSHHLVIQLQFPHHHFCNLVIVLLYRSMQPPIIITVKTTVYLLMEWGKRNFKNQAGDTNMSA